MSSRYSAESAASTSDSNEPGCESSPNAKPTQKPGQSSPGIGPECHVTRTLPDSTPSGCEVMAFNWQTGGDFRPGFSHNETQALHKGQTPAVFVPKRKQQPLKKLRNGGVIAREATQSTSFAEASRSCAKTSQSQENEPASPGKDQDCSMKPHESQTLFSDQGDGSSLRTYPDYLAPMEELTSGSFSRRWPTSGFTTSPGECWTADTSECPNEGGEYSSLPDVLEATVPSRFYLSQKAAAGILRRAEKRGKNLPPALDKALRALSGSEEPEATPNSTATEPMSQEAA